jgi:hypothetical protein
VRCGLPATKHRKPRARVDVRYRDERVSKPYKRTPTLFVGIDGEGQGRENHIYTMLCASDEHGDKEWVIENPNGLSTVECLQFITGFPNHVQPFAFSFNYDLTKILVDLPNAALYYLFRAELRQRVGKEAFKGPRAVRWKEWFFNLQGTKFSVRHASQKYYTIVWDVWKFYQCKFTSALEDWKVGYQDDIEQMKLMKDQRHLFDKLSKHEVKKYCLSECRHMASLARKLTEAHVTAGIPLKNYFGAGSSATSMLNRMEIKKYLKAPPDEMTRLVAMAFFGGRFENAAIGQVNGKVYNKDISSAYPYQLYFLPCLAHGEWHRTTRRNDIEDARLALVHYELPLSPRTRTKPWGPFPFRERDGSICYPISSGGGWIWKQEYLAGEALFDNIKFIEAWVYHTPCDCHPFRDIPLFYNERCRIGKEGPGIALKLGSNSCAGKTAQSVGSAPFRNFVYAGNINSGTRAQVLEALGLHSDWTNMLMAATDGILTRENVVLPRPRDTGTDIEFKDDKGNLVKKPLGGWETKSYDRGVFLARPGVYFPLNPTPEDIKVVRGRGVGRGVILQNHDRIVECWEQWDRFLRPRHKSDEYDKDGWPVLRVTNVSRFCGAKSSISRSMDKKTGKWSYNRAAGDHVGKSEPSYGQWVTREVVMSFNPKPKRESLAKDGRSLVVRRLPPDQESTPYNKANISEEARMLMMLTAEMIEQPDIDLADYEIALVAD